MKYIYILISSLMLLLAAAPVYAQATADTATADSTQHKVKKTDSSSHQLCIGVDLVNPITNYFTTGQYGYEFAADYYMRNEFYAELEGGWGGSTVTYSDLQYDTKNDFIRIGFNKSLLVRNNKKDWDMMFMGMRAGAANVARGAAYYTIVDSLWGSKGGYQPSQNFIAVWAEITGGMRVELVDGLFAGWNIRGKFMMNGKSFSDLSPLYIAGYGRGDKNTSFDFNLYISYGIRWNKHFKTVAPAPQVQPAPAK